MRTKTLWIAGTLLVVAGTAGLGLARFGAPWAGARETGGGESVASADTTGTTARRVTPLPVDGIVVERGQFVLTVRATGRVEAVRHAEISSRVGERVVSVPVQEGDRVRAGDPLVVLDPRPFEIARNEAAARLANAEADFRLRLLSDSTITDDRRELVAHRSGLTEARETLARAALDLDGARILAPFDGFVARVDAQPGERVVANAPLVRLVAPDPVRIPAEVLETDFGRLAPGAPARVRLAAFAGETFEGEVDALGPEIDPDRGTGIAWIRLPNADGRIRPGMWADVDIAGTVHADRLSVPRSAVLERDRRLLVFRASDGRAEWVYVDTGLESAERIEITRGLAPGDTVLVDGHLTLAHGAPVKVSR